MSYIFLITSVILFIIARLDYNKWKKSQNYVMSSNIMLYAIGASTISFVFFMLMNESVLTYLSN